MRINVLNSDRAMFYFAVLICTACCSRSELGSKGKLHLVDIESHINSFEFINLSLITDRIEYIPLETDSISLINGINKLINTNDRFIIHDGLSCKAFSKSGEYLCKYGNQGKGPGQFLMINTISYDQERKMVYIASPPQLLMEYSKHGDFIRYIEIPPEMIDSVEENVNYVTFGNNTFCGVTSKDHNKLFLFNDRKEVLATYPDYYDDPSLKGNILAYLGANSNVFVLGKNILYKDGLCDTVFYLTSDLHREPVYYFHFGNYSHLKEYLKSLSNYQNMEELKGLLDHCQITDLIEINDLLLFTCSFGNRLPKSEFIAYDVNQYSGGPFNSSFLGYINPIHGMYHKKSSKLVFLKKYKGYSTENGGFSGFVNDIDGGVPFWPIAQPNGQQLVGVIDAYELKAYVASEVFIKANPKHPERKKELKQLAENLDNNDNPVLMIVYLKK